MLRECLESCLTHSSFRHPFPHAVCVLTEEDWDCVCMCVCPCIVARQIQSSTWLTSDISVFLPPRCRQFLPSDSRQDPPPPAHTHQAHLKHTCIISLWPLTTLSLPAPLLLYFYCWGYLWAIMTAPCKHSSLSLASKACWVGPRQCNNRFTVRTAGFVPIWKNGIV